METPVPAPEKDMAMLSTASAQNAATWGLQKAGSTFGTEIRNLE